MNKHNLQIEITQLGHVNQFSNIIYEFDSSPPWPLHALLKHELLKENVMVVINCPEVSPLLTLLKENVMVVTNCPEASPLQIQLMYIVEWSQHGYHMHGRSTETIFV